LSDQLYGLDGDRRSGYAFCGSEYDTVRVDGNDIIANEGDSTRASDLATGTNPMFNCEKIITTARWWCFPRGR
jgi:hypothetical protein